MKKLMLSVLLFFIVTLVLANPFLNWGLIIDDYGFLHYAKTQSFLNFFKAHDVFHTFNPSNVAFEPPAFLTSFYRPLQFVLFAIQHYFFGLNAYSYLFFIAGVHAVNAVFLFHMLTWFVGLTVAFFGALFFAVHPTLFKWFGLVLNQMYVFDLFFLLIMILLLKTYLDTQKIIFYFLSCLMLLIQLFCKETLIVVPFWVLCGALIYRFQLLKTCFNLRNFVWALALSGGYWITCFLYLLVRCYVFWGNAVSSVSLNEKIIQFLVQQKGRFFDWVSFGLDMFYIGFIPSGNTFVKVILLLGIIALVAWPFLVKRQFLFLCFLILSIILFSWPSVLICHQPRYVYCGLPFVFLILCISIEFYWNAFPRMRKTLIGFLCCFFAVNGLWFYKSQAKKGQAFHYVQEQFETLARSKKIQNRVLVLVGLPLRWFAAGTAQALWLFQQRDPQPIFYDAQMFVVRSCDQAYQFIPNKVEIRQEKEKLVINIVDKQNNYFNISRNLKTKLGFIEIKEKDVAGHVTHIAISWEKDLLKQNPLFVTWNHETNKFKVLDV